MDHEGPEARSCVLPLSLYFLSQFVQRRCSKLDRSCAVSLEICDLNAQSAKSATFRCRIISPKLWTYTYERSGVTRTSHKLECFLVSSDPTMYCLGAIKDQEAKLKDLQHFKHGSCWLLSKVKLDAKADVRYNSCPNKVTVTLWTTTASPAEDNTLANMANEVVPAHGVNDILQLCDNRSIDLMGVLRDTEDNDVIATAKGKRQKYTLNIVDRTDADAGTYHVQIALWDAPESQWCSDLAKYKGSVVRLFGIYADFPNGNLALTASSSFRVADAGGSEKAERLQQASADLLTGDAVTLPAAATRSAGASWSTEH